MLKIDNAILGIALRIALAAPNKSTKKSRIMDLLEVGIIPTDIVEHLIHTLDLKGE